MTAAQTAVRIPVVDIPQGRARGLGALELLGPQGRIALPLGSVGIAAKMAGAVAEVELVQKFQNPHAEALEAEYVFPLPGGAAVSRFELRVAGRVVVGKVQERGEARRQYAEAIQQGKRAALLEQERGDVFTVSVGNLPPGEAAEVKICWSERLPVFEDGAAELRLPLVVAPRYIAGDPKGGPPAGSGTADDTDKVPDASRLTPPRLAPGFDPKVALSISVELLREGSGLDDLCCSQHAVSQQGGPESIKIELAREGELLDRDFVLRWRLAGAKVEPQLLVWKPAAGSGAEPALEGTFGMITLLPPRREGFLGLPRDVVFVLDRSGSMQGSKMISASRACAQLLRTLAPRDRFAIQAFDDHVEWLERGSPAAGAPQRWLRADEQGFEEGEKYLRAVNSRGGTELDLAMREALAEVLRRPVPEGPAGIPVIVLLTDGQIGDESSVLRRLQLELGESRVFTVGIDTAVNAAFLTRLAALGGGTASFVEPGTRLEAALRAVAREIGTPLVTDLQITGDGGAPLPDGALAPAELPDLFAGRPAAAYLKLPRAMRLHVTGKAADGSAFSQTVEPREVPLPALAQLWAKARVAELEDQLRLRNAGEPGPGTAEQLARQIVELAVRHVLLTRLTAFVAVDQEIVNPGGQGRKVVQPVHMPAQWELDDGSGGGPAIHAATPLGAIPGGTLAGGLMRMPMAASPVAAAPMAARNAHAGGGLRSLAQGISAGLGSLKDAFGGGAADAEDAKAEAAPPPVRQKAKRSAGKGRGSGAPAQPPAPLPPPSFAPPRPAPREADAPAASEADKAQLRKALDELAAALEEARARLAAGARPAAAPVEAARAALLKLLASSPLAVTAAALQRLLRSGLAELVAALGAPGAPVAALLELCTQRQRELAEARAALETSLGGQAPQAAGAPFWSASV